MQKVSLLAIESSCDDTSAAVIQDGLLLSNVIASQKVHEEYGGVVPELASRAHQQNIVPVIDTALRRAGIGLDQISAIAFTPAVRGCWVRCWSALRSPKDWHCRCIYH